MISYTAQFLSSFEDPLALDGCERLMGTIHRILEDHVLTLIRDHYQRLATLAATMMILTGRFAAFDRTAEFSCCTYIRIVL
jgi:hypothetical protein